MQNAYKEKEIIYYYYYYDQFKQNYNFMNIIICTYLYHIQLLGLGIHTLYYINTNSGRYTQLLQFDRKRVTNIGKL